MNDYPFGKLSGGDFKVMSLWILKSSHLEFVVHKAKLWDMKICNQILALLMNGFCSHVSHLTCMDSAFLVK